MARTKQDVSTASQAAGLSVLASRSRRHVRAILFWAACDEARAQAQVSGENAVRVLVVTLLALLEMCRMGKAEVMQATLFGDVRITRPSVIVPAAPDTLAFGDDAAGAGGAGAGDDGAESTSVKVTASAVAVESESASGSAGAVEGTSVSASGKVTASVVAVESASASGSASAVEGAGVTVTASAVEGESGSAGAGASAVESTSVTVTASAGESAGASATLEEKF